MADCGQVLRDYLCFQRPSETESRAVGSSNAGAIRRLETAGEPIRGEGGGHEHGQAAVVGSGRSQPDSRTPKIGSRKLDRTKSSHRRTNPAASSTRRRKSLLGGRTITTSRKKTRTIKALKSLNIQTLSHISRDFLERNDFLCVERPRKTSVSVRNEAVNLTGPPLGVARNQPRRGGLNLCNSLPACHKREEWCDRAGPEVDESWRERLC